jgi:hypothetical protein
MQQYWFCRNEFSDDVKLFLLLLVTWRCESSLPSRRIADTSRHHCGEPISPLESSCLPLRPSTPCICLTFSPLHSLSVNVPTGLLYAVTSVADPGNFVTDRGSISLTNGSGSGSCYFRQRSQNVNKKFLVFFSLLLFEGIFTSFFKDKK